jgi:hypothetical protein
LGGAKAGKRGLEIWRDAPRPDQRAETPDRVEQNPQLDPFDIALEADVKALVTGIDYDDLGNATLIEIEKRFQAKQFEMYLAARPQLELMMNQVSGKSLAEDEAKAKSGDEKAQAEAAKNKVLEERGAVLKAELRERLELQFMPDFMRARYVRQHGWPGAEKPLAPIKGVSADIARTIHDLAKDKKLGKFTAFWSQMTGENYARLELTAGIKREEG